jgi:hypothetical protein
VVSFDPSTNAALLASFKSKFVNFPGSAQVIGPYKGELSNGSATVELYKPDPPQGPPAHADETGFVPYVFVERVKYDDEAPWPAGMESPDATGMSLQRRVATDFANEPLNWKGANPTPGRANTDAGISAPTITLNPEDQAQTAGGTATFVVEANGSQLSYRWQFQGVQISGATNATLTLNNLSTNMAGSYRAMVINPAGIAFSSAATLILAEDDTIAPTVAISTPANNAKITSFSPSVTITGTAADNQGLAAVEVQVNDGSFAEATGTSSWTIDVILAPGTNIVRARAVDVKANHSAIASRTVILVANSHLNLTTNGLGSVVGASSSTTLEVGKTYRLTAKPAAGYIFSNWSGTITQTAPVLNFVMQTNLVIVANFVPNPFLAVAGTFNGLFHEDDEVQPASAGYFSLKLTTKGTFNGQVFLRGGKLPLKGTLAADGTCTVTILRGTSLSALDVFLAVALDGSDIITGSITDGDWTASLEGDRLTYAATQPAPQAGRYTFVFPGSEGTPGAPEGDSYGTLLITPTGQATFSGSLAENIKWTHKTTVSKNGEIPLYFAPYSGQGLFTGWLSFSDEPTSDLSGEVTWIKPSTAGGLFYPAGFTQEGQLVGSRYTMPASGQRVLNMTAGEFTLTGANLAQPYTNSIVLPPGISLTTNSPHKLTLKLSPPTGLLSGTFTPTGSTAVIKFNGVVLQSSTNAAGYFLHTNRTGRIGIEPAN